MGSNLSSTTTPQNPPSAMSSISPNSPSPDLKTLENQNPDPNSTPNQTPEIPDQPTNPNEKGQDQSSGESGEQVDGDEDEEEGECGFCLFMKGGGCKDAFVAWENCVKEGEKNKQDIVEKCFEVTSNLKKCMEAHSEYYEPILRAEKAADEEVKQELEREAKKNDVEGSSESKGIEQTVEIEVEKQN